MNKIALAAAAAAVALLVVPTLNAELRAERVAIAKPMPVRPNQPAAAGMVNLPYYQPDGAGGQWMIYQSGWVQTRADMPIYSQGAMLMINGNQPNMTTNQARVEEKTNDLIFENLNAAGFVVTRRISFNADEGYIRYVDIIRNPTAKDADVNVQVQTNLNYGVQNASITTDPKKKELSLAWIAATHAQGRTAVEVFNGRGAKQPLTINFQPGNSVVQAGAQINIPAGKEVAIMHYRFVAANADQGAKQLEGIKTAKLMAGIPPAIRRLIVNFAAGGTNFMGDIELIRGELLDVIEIRGGDRVNGTIRQAAYKIETPYGPVTVPADRVVAMVNVGQFRPRQLVITSDGEIFGGRVDGDSIPLELSSGQTIKVPLSHLTRLGYRKRTGEPEEWVFDKPMVYLRSGDRVRVSLPPTPVQVATRYGTLSLAPDSVAMVSYIADEHAVHSIELTDGSKFSGLVVGDTVDVKLASGQAVKFPAGSIRAVQMAVRTETEEEQPELKLANADSFVGSFQGQIRLETAFDTIVLNGSEIKKLTRAENSPADVTVTLWDATTVSGQIVEQDVPVKLVSGPVVKIPVALIIDYNQPTPLPSESATKAIRDMAAKLESTDWQERDRAEAALVQMGPVVVTVLRDLRKNGSPEMKTRIDSIFKALQRSDKPAASEKPAPGEKPVPPVMVE